MEEDLGKFKKSNQIILNGLSFCPINEPLLMKFLKIQEKIGDIKLIRKILSRLRHCKIEKYWKIYVEGALLEIKFGNLNSAHLILLFINKQLPNNGQISYELAKFQASFGVSIKNLLYICLKDIDNGNKYGFFIFILFFLIIFLFYEKETLGCYFYIFMKIIVKLIQNT